jgi:hypothetical protein
VIKDGVSHGTEPFELSGGAGAMMLLFVAKDAAAVQAGPHPDHALPAGTVEVAVVTASGAAVPGQEVVLAAVDAGGRTTERRARTGAGGLARFEKLAVSRGGALVASADVPGAPAVSPPFQLLAGAGTRLALVAHAHTSKSDTVELAGFVHVVPEPDEDAAQVVEVVTVANGGDATYDPGPDGLVLPLPPGARGVAPDPEGDSNLKLRGDHLVYEGAIPPGRTELRWSFRVDVVDGAVRIRQAARLPWRGFAVIVEKAPGISIEGAGDVESVDNEGTSFLRARGAPVSAGGEVAFAVTGLPRPDTTGRNVAAGIAILIAGWSVLASRRPRGAADGLRAERERLMDRLVSVSASGDDQRRATLVRRVADIDRRLEAGA